MSASITRRTVTQGTMWAIPTVAAAVAAPVTAASTTITVSCPDPSALKLQRGSVMSVSSQLAGSLYKGGTYYGVNVGQWNVPAAKGSDGSTITGYYMIWGQCGVMDCDSQSLPGVEFAVTNGDGAKHKGRVSLDTPVACSPQTAGAGLATSIGIQTDIPYGLDVCSSKRNLGCVSIPVTIIYLNGLQPLYAVGADGKPKTCCIYFNACFKTGCQANYVTSSSWTTTPLYT